MSILPYFTLQAFGYDFGENTNADEAYFDNFALFAFNMDLQAKDGKSSLQVNGSSLQ